MKVLGAAVAIALLTGPGLTRSVHAADDHIQQYGEPDPVKTRQERENDKAAQQAYKRSLGNVPDKGPSDPWGNVRSDSAPKSVAKDSKPRAKTGSAAK
jgi:hypothetical protein